ncbi:MAG: hypothetical protein SOR61_09155 [Evtepia sp.]|uniref:hypothetical protein n=1 Tax=Evtepia sp. TaxID=2773933 RepID=UPI002A75C5C7|nr:hypothetical protein [Evtepia sp.]MDY3015319.1 hypothetical protein [Evtepia sp.]
MAEPKKNFWQKHPGLDLYSLFWFLLFLVLAGVGRFYPPLFIPAAVVLLYLLFRVFSKKGENRQMENARFLSLIQSIVRWAKGKRAMQTDKQYYYFKCPNCGQPMRVPWGLGKIEITCRSCGSRFETKS